MSAVPATLTAMSDQDASAVVELEQLTVELGGRPVLRAVDLRVEPASSVALLGPSGSGKTTLLYAIAGFLPLSAGTIRLEGSLASAPGYELPTERRPVAMVFQHYGLWPHLDALDTVAYPLRRAGMPKAEARAAAVAYLEQVGLADLAARRPAELSGGEQQRVGLARALARRPRLYLLDEPTAHLDAALKADLRSELARRVSADGAAAIYATHDVDEALAVADTVVVLREGVVVQVGSPTDVYARPVDAWTARLTGPASFIEALPGEKALAHEAGPAGVVRGEVEGGGGGLLVRPDWVRFGGELPARVEEVRYRGTHTDYRLRTGVGSIILRDPGPPRFGAGEGTSCSIERTWRMAGAR
jgi:iron(III) transport system ATP-binding protein